MVCNDISATPRRFVYEFPRKWILSIRYLPMRVSPGIRPLLSVLGHTNIKPIRRILPLPSMLRLPNSLSLFFQLIYKTHLVGPTFIPQINLYKIRYLFKNIRKINVS